MTYARRKRLRELADAEARGESFWTDELDEEARRKLLYLAQDAVKKKVFDDVDLDITARSQVLRDNGWANLAGETNPQKDVALAILRGSNEVVFSYLEVLHTYLVDVTSTTYLDVDYNNRQAYEWKLPVFVETIRTILREHRVTFDFVDGKFIPLESKELHEAIVVPAITLLGGNPEFAQIESAYMEALEEIHNGTPDDAITDAATALQETLEFLGCDGNSLGPLIKSARNKGLIAPHDEPLLHWVSADRSEKGDAHEIGKATVEDAWLTIHVVGALIVRLLQGPVRASP